MKILLVNPPLRETPSMGRPKMMIDIVGKYPPLGILYIGGYLKKYNPYAELKLFDGGADGVEAFQQVVEEFKPDVVGMTTYTFTFSEIKKYIEYIKQTNPSTFVCLGGHHVKCYPNETLKFAEVDAVVAGEGEIAFSELIDALYNKKTLHGIKGIGFKDAETNIIMNEPRDKIKSLDALPFPLREYLDLNKYYCLVGKKRYSTTILSSRDCPYKCLFCSHALSGYRSRSIGNVLDEIEHCLSLGIEDFFFYDDTFNVSKKRLKSFCDGIREKGLKFSWSFRGRVDAISYDLLKDVKELGCYRIQFGVEAGTEKALKNIRKETNLDQVRLAFKWTNSLKIQTVGYFIIGNPGETREDIQSTIDFAIELEPTYANFSILVSTPDSKMNDIMIEKGLMHSDFWLDYMNKLDNVALPPVWGETFSRSELEELQKYAFKKFYQRPKYYFRMLREINCWADFVRKLKAGVLMFYWNFLFKKKQKA